MYCIACECDVEVKLNSWHHKECGEISILCPGPFTTCPPPELDEQMWKAIFNAPSQEELEQECDL